MDISATPEVIRKLKSVKEQQNLSIPKIKEKVDATGVCLSMTTLRRVFADGSEEDNFHYENTIRPIAQALLIDADDDVGYRAKAETFKAIIRMKEEKIEELRSQLEAFRKEQDEKCEECRKRQDFLRAQIDLKDQRMDRKDEIIERLLDALHPKEPSHAKD